ncbi:Scr1 family TA system antitoxin-like transcriptional regulator, partial [Actinomadura kijaniata]|uniref:Scr1 family TA system antitoxin-like transcriptional regulator n=1 Tax=Actinomadura kijaniata TaxID=46161 RepID=UPI003F197C12
PGSGECMEEQFARVVEVAGLPHVRLGVVPDVRLRGVGLGHVALHGFTLVDESAVTVETFTREIGLTDEREVRAYAEVFAQVERVAVFGESARELVEQAAADVRRTLKAIH